MRCFSFLLCVACCLTNSRTAVPADWPGWLGPNRDGWVKGFQPPKAWPQSLEKAWAIKVGTGYGSPLVAGNLVYQHARQGKDEVLMCIERDSGKIKWRKRVAVPFKIGGGGERHGKGPKSCPVMAQGRVITLSITGVLSARDAKNGDLLWTKDYSKRFYSQRHKMAHPRWGASTSPIVDGDRVIVHLGTDGKGALMAHDLKTGKELWSQGKLGPSYSSPLVVGIAGIRQVIDWNEKTLCGVEIRTGKLLWSFDAPQTWTDQNMPTPVFAKGRILLGAENRGIRCLQPQKSDAGWMAKQHWHQKKLALDMATAIVNGNSLYGMSHYQGGRFFCLDLDSGKINWQGPPRTGRNVTFLAAPGVVLGLINHGELRVIAAKTDAYEKVASYKLAKTPAWAPPVLLPNGILVKDLDTLTFWKFPTK